MGDAVNKSANASVTASAAGEPNDENFTGDTPSRAVRSLDKLAGDAVNISSNDGAIVGWRCDAGAMQARCARASGSLNEGYTLPHALMA